MSSRLTTGAWFNIYTRSKLTTKRNGRPGRVVCLQCGCKFRTLVPSHVKVKEMNAMCPTCKRKAKPQATAVKPDNFLAKITWTKSKRKYLR